MPHRLGCRFDRTGHVAELRRDAGGRTALGAVFVLVGAALLAWQQATAGDPSALPPVLAWGLASAPLVLGLLLVAYRSGVRFDAAHRTVDCWWRIGPYVHSRRSDVGAWEVVRARRETQSGRNRKTHYSVELVGRNGDWLTLQQVPTPLGARRLGELIAGFLQLPLRESVTGPESERAPGDLDRSFRDQVLAEGERPPYPVLPLASRVFAENRGSRWLVSFPAAGALRSGLVLALLMLPGSAIAVGFVLHWMVEPDTTSLLLMLGLVLLPEVGLAAWAVLRGSERQTLEILPGALTFERRWALGRRTVERMTWDELEQVASFERPHTPLGSFVSGGHVVLVSDDAQWRIGRAGRPEDRVFLVALIRHALTEVQVPSADGVDESAASPASTGDA